MLVVGIASYFNLEIKQDVNKKKMVCCFLS